MTADRKSALTNTIYQVILSARYRPVASIPVRNVSRQWTVIECQ
jgi:hypothetical protein